MPEVNADAAAPAANPAESSPAKQPEAENQDGLAEQASAKPDAEEQTANEGGEPQQKATRKRELEYRNRARDQQRVNERLFGIVERMLTSGASATSIEKPAGPPRREDFETYEAYFDAKADYQIAQRFETVAQQAAQARQQQAAQQREGEWLRHQEAATKRHEDWFDKVSEAAEDGAYPPVVMQSIMDAGEFGTVIAYYLANHPQEAARIVQLSPAAQGREIGKIEARLEAKLAQQQKRSNAPPPIDPVSGGKGAPSMDLSKASSQKEYEAMRRKQIAAEQG